MKTTLILIGAAVVLGVGWFLVKHTNTQSGQVCAQDMKTCPDGTLVGRTGPHCEFAACSSVQGVATSTTVTIGVGQSATLLGLTLHVVSVTEDSRCPTDVQCITSGTVRIRVNVDPVGKDYLFTLGEAQEILGNLVKLESVEPKDKKSTTELKPSDYRFTFSIVPVGKG